MFRSFIVFLGSLLIAGVTAFGLIYSVVHLCRKQSGVALQSASRYEHIQLGERWYDIQRRGVRGFEIINGRIASYDHPSPPNLSSDLVLSATVMQLEKSDRFAIERTGWPTTLAEFVTTWKVSTINGRLALVPIESGLNGTGTKYDELIAFCTALTTQGWMAFVVMVVVCYVGISVIIVGVSKRWNLYRTMRRRKFQVQGLCCNCGYAVGSDSIVCPECGRRVEKP